MKKQRVYISGRISGLSRQDYLSQFKRAEVKLERLGYKVCNPTKALPSRFLWIYKMLGYNLTLIYDLWLLSRCDKIYMLDGWENSRGARLEHTCAESFGIKELILF